MAPETSNPPADELDDLFDYNVDMQDVFRDANVAMDAPSHGPATHTKPRDKDLGLGIDEEIKVTKKRAPVPKLDEDRLLSQAGIPKLRRLARERFRFKGKGHEYSDLACLLNVYQFWLDDLYPRAKFADGLAMIEKLGHSKRIQVMRREWINEGRPRERYGNTDVPHDGPQVTKVSQEAGNTSTATSANHIRGDSKLRGSSAPTDDDLYEASPPRQQPTANPNSSIESTSVGQASHSGTNNDIPKDDLDALLAEASTDNTRDVPASSASSSRPNAMLSSKKDDFDAEMEVMADMDDMW